MRFSRQVSDILSPSFSRALSACFAISCLFLSGLALSSCELFAGGGGGTETESKVVAGYVVDPDGSPVMEARVYLRPADYLTDLVSTEEISDRIKDTITDKHGRYELQNLPPGDYRVEIAGSEARGSIQDFSLIKFKERLELPVDTLKPRGSIRGFFAPDSEVQLTRFVQVFGMERLVKADFADGGFILFNLPEGDYDIRCSSLQPFRRDTVLRDIPVHSGRQTVLKDPVKLEKEARLAFSVDALGLKIEGVDSTNPVILDNERWDNGVDNEYVWAKASLGALDLRGNIVTNDFRGTQVSIDRQMAEGREERRLALLSGLTGVPDLTPGAPARLKLPASGRIEDILPAPSAGSDLIVAEARKATPEKPLVVVAGGPLTTVAQAYLTDPSIAPRMVVAGVFSYTIQAEDSVANYLVAKKCRFVQWGRTYSWTGKADTVRSKEIPPSLMGEKARAFMAGKATTSLGDLPPVAFLFRRSLWKTAQMVKVSANLEVRPASDITFDFLDIPASANDWTGYDDEFYSALTDPRAYHATALPARLEAEGLLARTAVTAQWIDSSAGAQGAVFASAAWAEYKVSLAQAGVQKVTVRYKAAAAARVAFGVPGQPPLGELALPASADWSEATLSALSLEAATFPLRVSAVSGPFTLDWIEIKP